VTDLYVSKNFIYPNMEKRLNFKGKSNGIIIASSYFDQVGPFASYDAMASLNDITSFLEVKRSDVTIVLNYRTPRVDQWISMWKDAPKEFAAASYEEWMCNPYENDDNDAIRLRLDMLGAQMNPLSAANEYLKNGYNVKLIDQGGVEAIGKNVVTIIATHILQAATNNTDVISHE